MEGGRASSPTPGKKDGLDSVLDLSLASAPIPGHHLTYHRSPHRIHITNITTIDTASEHSPEPEPELVAGTPTHRSLATVFDPRGMLPTPAKTPRKRPLESEEALHATARRLFSNPPAKLDDIMPTPRKNRNTKFGLFSLDDAAEEEPFEIFTDSKERIPTVDESEENPFFTRKGKGKARFAKRARKADPVENEEADGESSAQGMVFMHRGKKVFRKFEDDDSSLGPDQPDLLNEQLLNQAEGHARRPFTRSSITPRLLFQDEIKAQRETTPIVDEEEALTDIEYPLPTPSRKGHKTIDVGSFSKPREETPTSPTGPPKRQITLDSWTRVVKSSTRKSPRGKKRGAEEIESSSSKRTRTLRP